MSLHDLLWCFVAALSPAPFEKGDEEAGEEEVEKKEHDVVGTVDVLHYPVIMLLGVITFGFLNSKKTHKLFVELTMHYVKR